MVFDHAIMSTNVKTRTVSLTRELEAFIDDRVASGRFRSASEVVRAALRLLEDDERLREASGRQTDGLTRPVQSRAVPRR